MKIYKKSLLYGALAFSLCMAGGCYSNIDLGPEGGVKGGTVIATGTPEKVADNPNSYTGVYIKKMLDKQK